jgi:nitrite reductase/ring-hydroxylating ferredoxin subunit
MRRRHDVVDTRDGGTPPSGQAVPLGGLDDFRRCLPLRLRLHGREFRLVELDGEILAHPTFCPHLGGPLEDAPLEDGRITCPWHGYGYDLRNGRCVTGQRLTFEPRVRVVVDPERREGSLVW